MFENTKVICTYKTRNNKVVIRKFKSRSNAAKVLDLNVENITNCCFGISKTVKGYVFQFDVVYTSQFKALLSRYANVKRKKRNEYRRLYLKAWIEKHRYEYNRIQQRYMEKHRKEIAEKTAKWKLKHKDKVKAYSKMYYKKEKEKPMEFVGLNVKIKRKRVNQLKNKPFKIAY